MKLPTQIKPCSNKILAASDLFDYNGNGILSLAEIDGAIIKILPSLSANKPAIMRAYRAADITNDGFIDRIEFKALVLLLFHYNDLYILFKQLDTNGDKRVSFGEFVKGHALIGVDAGSKIELKRVFDGIDLNGGGMILFDEFCLFMAKMRVSSVV